MIKSDNFPFFHKIICCWCILESPRGEAILIHIHNIRFYGEQVVIKVETLL